MPACPQGHTSEWADFCSVCGAALDPPPPGDATPGGTATAGRVAAGVTGPGQGPAAASTGTGRAGRGQGSRAGACPHCGYPHGPDDAFCESCGYDFATGQLPSGPIVTPATASGPASTPAPGPAPDAAACGAAAPPDAAPPPGTWWATLDVDRAYYERLAAGGPVAFPADPPPPQSIPLLADTVTIGRRSRSRGTAPGLDLSGPPEDPAVSHAHATLVRQRDGSYAIIDAGSTNGTRLNDDGDPIPRNVLRPLADGDRILLGAWSRITVERR